MQCLEGHCCIVSCKETIYFEENKVIVYLCCNLKTNETHTHEKRKDYIDR